MSIWRHLRAAALLPAMVTIVVPGVILLLTKDLHVGWELPRPFAVLPLALSVCPFAAGVSLMVATIRLFATSGRGTLAPWDPTQRLVVLGPYRYVRNPMISGVLCILLGEVALLGSLALLAWTGLFFVLNGVYIPLSEEPGLEERFGDDYRTYKRHVPRWLPRLTPWQPDAGTGMLSE